MPLLNIFLIMGVVALIVGLFTKGQSAIWGGATAGFIIGIIIGLIKHDLSDILRAALIGADVGLFTEILFIVGKKIDRG